MSSRSPWVRSHELRRLVRQLLHASFVVSARAHFPHECVWVRGRSRKRRRYPAAFQEVLTPGASTNARETRLEGIEFLPAGEEPFAQLIVRIWCDTTKIGKIVFPRNLTRRPRAPQCFVLRPESTSMR